MSSFYFAFGSNMNPARMYRRGLRFRRVFSGYLPGYVLCFDKASRFHPRSGHANIHKVTRRSSSQHPPASQDRVEGVLYELVDHAEIRRLDQFERTPINYSREVFPIRCKDAGTCWAWTYIANSGARAPGLLPERNYMNQLLAGSCWLSAPYQTMLRQWQLADESPLTPR